jgi:hypothetical protein
MLATWSLARRDYKSLELVCGPQWGGRDNEVIEFGLACAEGDGGVIRRAASELHVRAGGAAFRREARDWPPAPPPASPPDGRR